METEKIINNTKKPSSFLIRTISGSIFVAIIVCFFLLRQKVNENIFSILIWFLCAMGTFEVARAIKVITTKYIYITQIIFGIAFIPCYYLLSILFSKTFSEIFTIDLIVIVSFVCAIMITAYYQQILTVKEVAKVILPVVYPSALLYSMLMLNTMFINEIGFIGLLLVFVISPLSDTLAYLVGMTYSKIKKGKAKKLCPILSPNKTVAGAIGGIIGGVLGSLLVYWIFKPTSLVFSNTWIFIILGFLGSIATEGGDLFESLIKRKMVIKDMGKIMPGHGGVMDRIDGISLCSVVVFITLFLSVYVF